MTIFFSQKVKVSPGIHLDTWKYNVCSIKLKTKLISLRKIEVEKISSFLLNKYAVHDFLLLPVMCFIYFILRCIISAYFIKHTIDKHSF